ncbi:MAG: phenylacetate--CoA ligase family protein, partial [Gemmatimonadota bacterium]|nr:phenylacetate--CoA ligase family protein [Gemmatimonadota bacterium]
MIDPTDRIFDREAEAPDDWGARQDALAREAVRIAWEGTREGRARLERSGLDPDRFAGVSDLKSVEVLSKDALPELQAQDPPFGGMLAVPLGSLKRVYQSPGPIMDPEGQGADFWRMAPAAWAAGFRAGDVVLNTLSYHLTPGGHMLDAGLRHLGCVVIPGGVG